MKFEGQWVSMNFTIFLDTKECSKTEFQCINGEKCIDKQNVCNGYFDCQGKFILGIHFRNQYFENKTLKSSKMDDFDRN